MRLSIGEGLLRETFAVLSGCGDGSAECVCWWIGPVGAPKIDGLVHPEHSSSPAHYEIDDEWLHRFWIDLADQRHAVFAQVHTHPGSAYHSATDNDFALIHTPGFLSLVIPNFALGPADLTDAYLAERDASGVWRAVKVSDRIELCP